MADSAISANMASLSSFASDVTTRTKTSPALAIVAGATLLSSLWVVYDYQSWLAFGTGGTPATFRGYLRMTRIRLQRMFSSDDLTDASNLNPANGPSYLPDEFVTKHARPGSRPKIMSRTMPQRQQPFPKTDFEAGIEDKVAKLVERISKERPDILVLAPSKTEGLATDGIYAKSDLSTLSPVATAPQNKLLALEIAHAHPAESSFHVWLSEADAKKVVESGWGERFPLVFVDKGWTMVYAPRTTEELAVVEMVVRAGVSFITGVDVRKN